LLLVTMFVFLQTIYFQQHYIISAIVLAVFFVAQIVSFIRIIEKQYKQLSHYVLSLKNDDGGQTFRHLINDPSTADFGVALQELAEYFKDSRYVLQEQTLLLTTVLQHSDAGIIAFDQQGKISLCNKVFQQLVFYKKLHQFDDLVSHQPLLAQHITKLGQHSSGVLQIDIDGEAHSLMVRVTQANLKGRMVTLVVVQNIQQELAQQEAKSWQQLIRVLTHEMANSITPIASLANTAHFMVEGQECLQGEDLDDLMFSLATIDKRSQGLLTFIDSYRDLSQLPMPELVVIDIVQLYENSVKLLQNKINEISVTIIVEPVNLKISADSVQLEQVIINLLLNAIEALENTPAPNISLKAGLTTRGRILLQVIDNGCGMVEEIQQKLFLPFFTTKARGTGIGLALSKQIIGRHGGNISVQSSIGSGTIMAITLY